MSTPTTARHAAGTSDGTTSVGGRFRATTHTEPVIALGAPVASTEFVQDRLEAGGFGALLGEAEIGQVTSRLNAARTFADEDIEREAEAVYRARAGISLRDGANARSAVFVLRGEGHQDLAEAVDRLFNTRTHATPEGSTHQPVPAEDPRVQDGQVFDTITVEGTTFHRLRPGVEASTPYRLRLQTNRPMTDAEQRNLAALTGYAYKAAVRGEPLGEPERDSPYSFIVDADTTKSRVDDLGAAMSDFVETLPAMLEDGSPIRTTNQKGAGTAGTRLVPGFGEPDLRVEIYVDDAWGI
ncbi:hypothetical protein V6N00_13350 [Tersicoccus sp. MR15.9]|uniref:hypothetical protein n=1 Tax=Tersicoccus mangrovi TaxID=3121635 RepID=UPI002FE6A635